ncbi:hypothetical protein B7494_g8096 [Chlorociboria aeruginascens]|nr:hypothetical protein B7494_g8096 [Chlorociboria aeruginascens]
MAAVSATHTSVVADVSPSFSRFRVNQFVDIASKSTNNAHTQLNAANSDLNTESMAQSAPSSSGQNTEIIPSIVPSRPTTEDQNSSPGFGTLELVEVSSNPVSGGILGPNKDGRVRNGVPSKLKGKTDNKKGNFGVMHMEMSSGKKTERDAAARRTSENTAEQAKVAQEKKYIPPKKKALDDEGIRASPFDHKQRGRPLAPDETKYEQARLLTLLRSINPITVVDQICKAIAYFGGIPGAPPPDDGIFPESANTRETGALFIGWLAEIFPDLSRSPEVPRQQELPPAASKKSRGRPTKSSQEETETPNNTASSSKSYGYGHGQAIPPPAWTLPPSIPMVNTHTPTTNMQATHVNTEQKHQDQIHTPTTPAKQYGGDSQTDTMSASKRRRGRPKGSRNKGRIDPKIAEDMGMNETNFGSLNHTTSGEQNTQSLLAGGMTEKSSGLKQEQPSIIPQSTNSNITNPPQGLHYSEQQWQGEGQKDQINSFQNVTPGDELSPEERAVLEAFRTQPPQTIAMNEAPIARPTENVQKRKRAPPKTKAPPPPTIPVEQVQTTPSTNAISLPNDTLIEAAKNNLQWASVDTTAATSVPPPKRQRKSKVQGLNDQPPRRQTASAVSSGTPPISTTTIPDSTISTTQQNVSVTRPPAEGLEAHFERFANLQQQNGRSQTPSINPQQQIRQHQKSSSIPQQAVQQVPQQQQQSNLQTTSRDEQKLAQTTTAMPSTYYSQRTQGSSYNQQYPSQQTSQQQYNTHQASPQMSTNSYRASNAHSLAQASPQFSQPDNTFRTASPHTIAQPSPSFSQSDSTFRSSSAHPITQPTPSFTQPENPYRASNAHTVTQTTSSFPTRTTQSSHQNHYNHFHESSSYMDLPTLDSLGHSGTSSNTNVGISTGAYGQSLGVGVGATRSGSHSIYGTSSGLNNTFDTGTNDLLRGVSRSGSSSVYGTSSGLNNAFDTSANEQDMRERLLRGLGRRG